jgi:hypothetical protein
MHLLERDVNIVQSVLQVDEMWILKYFYYHGHVIEFMVSWMSFWNFFVFLSRQKVSPTWIYI